MYIHGEKTAELTQKETIYISRNEERQQPSTANESFWCVTDKNEEQMMDKKTPCNNANK